MSVDIEKTVTEVVHRKVGATSAKVTVIDGKVSYVELSWFHRSDTSSMWRNYEMQDKVEMLQSMYVVIHDVLDHLGELPEDFTDGNE